ncbi:butyrophilin subfamily 2 member A1-like isoform X2 [Ambystoma mexicanum]|uniref:butyrophilin subfamily 2 member A1-like isoform X2 n=1 Tax=Ambystoma mexicanum TaxID=8296 RepID=UPI0037E8BEBE
MIFRSSSSWHAIAIILLAICASIAEKFDVIALHLIIEYAVGQDAVLRCQLNPQMSAEDMLVAWQKTDRRLMAHKYHLRNDTDEGKDPEFLGRTEFIKDGIVHGSVALKIKKVRVSDEGQYSCLFQSDSYHNEAFFEMKVTGYGSDPFIEVDANGGVGVRAVCKSEGWYPKPEVTWKGERGNVVSAISIDRRLNDSGLYSIESAILINQNLNQNVSCYINNTSRNQIQMSAIYFTDSFFMKDNPWMVALCVILILWALSLLPFCWYIRRLLIRNGNLREAGTREIDHLKREKDHLEQEKVHLREASTREIGNLREASTREIGTLLEELKWRRAIKNAAQHHDVTLDPETNHCDLALSDDRRSVKWSQSSDDLPKHKGRFDHRPCVLGSQGFTKGRHYWTVEVGERKDCIVGVILESANRNGDVRITPNEGIFSVSLREAIVRAKTIEGPRSVDLEKIPTKFGVFLDCDKWVVFFYNAENMEEIYVFKIKDDNIEIEDHEAIFPFFYVGPGAELKM